MLTLEKCPAVLQHLNAYTETHGEDKVPATTLKLTVVRANTVLDEFERGLRRALYRKADVISAQQNLDIPRDEATADGITALRFSSISTVRLTSELIGARVVIESDGLIDEPPIGLADVTVDSYRADLLDGGSVELTMRVKCKPTPEQFGELYALLKRDVLLTVEPAAAKGE